MLPGNFTVLIVDDSVLFRQRVTCLLNDRNLNPVLQACNYEEAVNWLLKTEVHLAMLDISMPGKNGIELLKLIKSRYPDTRVWMMSNYADDHYKQICFSTGAEHFFDKSFDFEEIENTTTRFLHEIQNQN